eukprot:scaffold54828_cov30-Tisochrysis_lutea.AAC.12
MPPVEPGVPSHVRPLTEMLPVCPPTAEISTCGQTMAEAAGAASATSFGGSHVGTCRALSERRRPGAVCGPSAA